MSILNELVSSDIVYPELAEYLDRRRRPSAEALTSDLIQEATTTSVDADHDSDSIDGLHVPGTKVHVLPIRLLKRLIPDVLNLAFDDGDDLTDTVIRSVITSAISSLARVSESGQELYSELCRWKKVNRAWPTEEEARAFGHGAALTRMHRR